jgi:hypothetical protein
MANAARVRANVLRRLEGLMGLRFRGAEISAMVTPDRQPYGVRARVLNQIAGSGGEVRAIMDSAYPPQ